MSLLFYWTGIAVWSCIAVYLAGLALVPLVQVTSYFAVCIVGAFRHDRWRLIRWRGLPRAFLVQWWEWLRCGAPDKISGPYVTWEGAFKWSIAPKVGAAPAHPGERKEGKGD